VWRLSQATTSSPGTVHAGSLGRWRASWDRRLLSARHGWLRRNALSPHGVSLGSAPGAPFGTGCSSANRALAGKLQRDGIVAVPEVFDAGCLALSPPGRGVRAARPSRVLSDSSPWLAVHGDARRNAKRCGNRENLAAHQCSAHQRWFKGPMVPKGPLYRVDGPSGFTQAAENHGRTISERHNRNPQRRANRV
jgi:hypothetical protein